MNNIYFLYLVSFGLAGGNAIVIVAIINIIIKIYRHFTWEELKITEEEKEKIHKMIVKENPLDKLISDMTAKRGFNWSSWIYNKATGKLRIRIK